MRILVFLKDKTGILLPLILVHRLGLERRVRVCEVQPKSSGWLLLVSWSLPHVGGHHVGKKATDSTLAQKARVF